MKIEIDIEESTFLIVAAVIIVLILSVSKCSKDDITPNMLKAKHQTEKGNGHE